MSAIHDQVRAIVGVAGSEFVVVNFTKKDGTDRRIIFNPKTRFYIKGADASPSAQQAVATRAERHPEFLNVFDIQKHEARSINMDTVHTIRVRGVEFNRVGEIFVQKNAE